MKSTNPAGWRRPHGYSNGMSAAGRLVFVAGQIGWNPLTQRVETQDFAAQTRLALDNIVAVLASAGAQPEHVTRLTWFITDKTKYLDSLTPIGQAYREVFGKHYPAMAVVVVAGLLEEGAMVEIEATAVVPE